MRKVFIIGMLASVIFTGCGQVTDQIGETSGVNKDSIGQQENGASAALIKPLSCANFQTIWDNHHGSLCFGMNLTWTGANNVGTAEWTYTCGTGLDKLCYQKKLTGSNMDGTSGTCSATFSPCPVASPDTY